MHPLKLKRLHREEMILHSLKKLDYLTRKQIQRLHDLGSDRNAHRILQQMDDYLNYFYDGQRVYYLSKEGRSMVNANNARSKLSNAQHYLMRNDLYIYLGQPATWRNEVKLKFGDITVVSDAIYKRNRMYHIIEIDNLQHMKQNSIKIDKYRRMIAQNAFKGIPKLIWVTTSHHRQKALPKLCEGLDCVVYLNTDIGG